MTKITTVVFEQRFPKQGEVLDPKQKQSTLKLEQDTWLP